MSRWFDGSSRSIRSGLSSSSLASISRDCWPPENVRAGRSKSAVAKPRPVEDLLDAVVDRVGVLVLEPVVQLVVAAGGAVAVGVVLGLGHLLRGLFQLALEVDERGEPRPGDGHQASGRRANSGCCRSRLTRMPGRT